MRVFGILLEACTKADTKHDIGPTCLLDEFSLLKEFLVALGSGCLVFAMVIFIMAVFGDGILIESSGEWGGKLVDGVANNYVTIGQLDGGTLRDKNAKESWALLEDLFLYDNESWNDPRDFAKPVKAISLPQDVPSTSDHRLIELKNQVQHLMEAHLALKSPIQVNKIAFLCEICSGPHNTQYCMENLEQDFVDYISSRNNKVGDERKEGEGESHDVKRDDPDNRAHGDTKGVDEVDKESEESEKVKKEEEDEEDDLEYINTNPSSPSNPSISFITKKVVRFANGNNEISYKMPHKIEKFKSLTNLEKEHTKFVYFRNKEDKRRGVEYVMNKILGFYKECLELGPEYLTDWKNEKLYLMGRSPGVLKSFTWKILG
nr:MAK10-like protein [Tanacetum cinerariifolium]